VPRLTPGNRLRQLGPARRMALSSGINLLTAVPWDTFLAAYAGTLQTAGGSVAVADTDPVGRWTDQSGNGKHASQTTAGIRGILKTSVQNNLPVVRLNGTDQWYDMTGLTRASGAHTIFAAINPGNLAGLTLKYLFDSLTGRITLAAAADVANRVGWQTDEGWSKPSVSPAGVNGFQILTWVLNADGTGEMFRNGGSLGTGTYTAKAIGGACSLGASTGGAGAFFPVDIGFFGVTGPQPAGTVARIHTALRATWGV
jgi:hypothetical protein